MKNIILCLFCILTKAYAQNPQLELLRNKTFKVIQTDKDHPQFKDTYFIFRNSDTLLVKKDNTFYKCAYWDGDGYVIVLTDLPHNKGTISSTDYLVVKKLKKNMISLTDSLLLMRVNKIE
ncbi:MAG: hypothetical protein K0S33_3115 [Bacteroidetes bacterium]|jgi:hypothetical protein|nr:hypothetical protein [Bacteroidota bacterium]